MHLRSFETRNNTLQVIVVVYIIGKTILILLLFIVTIVVVELSIKFLPRSGPSMMQDGKLQKPKSYKYASQNVERSNSI